jgi:SAM-dependent methyltransferase
MAGSRAAPETAVLSLGLEVYNETMTKTKLGSYIVAGILSMAFAAAQSPKPARTPDVPYVPTTEKAVQEMLKLANVQKSDVLYDLGCGDGRIVITAAKLYGTRGVGIDINPDRIKEAKANAKREGVEDLVRFEENDLFVADIKEATVVTLFLLSSVNLKLRPRLLQELKPGTRVVSNTFDMGDWKPEKEAHVGESEGEDFSGLSQRLFLWTIPARK